MSFDRDLTICICTRDRPDDLERALASVVAHAPAAEIVVSDDGGGSALPSARRYEQCRWQAGPESGLGANRNAAVLAVETPWVLFLDDDARLGEAFVEAIANCLDGLRAEDRARTVVTGRERKNGVLVDPHDVDFLGFQRRPYELGAPLHTVVINAAVWPRGLFDWVSFDERLLYGSDEVDLSYSALTAGYRIELCPEAVNDHEPSSSGRGEYQINAHVSRLRTGIKRNWLQRHDPLRTLAFAVVAPIHLIVSELRENGMGGLRRCATIFYRWLFRGA
jgi:glycosyltransferase involved in cell wall biosynthesis